VILNDNDMSIAPPVGAMSAYLSRVISSSEYRKFRHIAKQLSTYFPRRLQTVAERAEEYARGLATGGTLFEAGLFGSGHERSVRARFAAARPSARLGR